MYICVVRYRDWASPVATGLYHMSDEAFQFLLHHATMNGDVNANDFDEAKRFHDELFHDGLYTPESGKHAAGKYAVESITAEYYMIECAPLVKFEEVKR